MVCMLTIHHPASRIHYHWCRCINTTTGGAMRNAEIEVGKHYVVRVDQKALHQHYGNNVPNCWYPRHVQVLEKLDTGLIIGAYDTLLPDPSQVIGADQIAARLMGNGRRYVKGRKLLSFMAGKVICTEENWGAWLAAEEARRHDGRPDKDTPMSTVEGTTFSQPKIAVNA
jgi:hypothetical protein